jgi:hypothetical protein
VTNTPTLTGHVCDYCDQPATLIVRETGDKLCRADANDQFDRPSEWVTKLTATTLRMYGK